MWLWIHHWIYEDLWIPVWPNWAAGAVVAVLGYTWGKKEIIKFHKHLDANHEAMKEHINKIRSIK